MNMDTQNGCLKKWNILLTWMMTGGSPISGDLQMEDSPKMEYAIYFLGLWMGIFRGNIYSKIGEDFPLKQFIEIL